MAGEGGNGGAQTISLHNIRYEERAEGGNLWLMVGGREIVIGSVYRSMDGARWQAWYGGKKAGEFESKELARQVLEAIVKAKMEAETDLT